MEAGEAVKIIDFRFVEMVAVATDEAHSEDDGKAGGRVRGHSNYYGVSGSYKQIQTFWKHLQYTTYRVLNRRH